MDTNLIKTGIEKELETEWELVELFVRKRDSRRVRLTLKKIIILEEKKASEILE